LQALQQPVRHLGLGQSAIIGSKSRRVSSRQPSFEAANAEDVFHLDWQLGSSSQACSQTSSLTRYHSLIWPVSILQSAQKGLRWFNEFEPSSSVGMATSIQVAVSSGRATLTRRPAAHRSTFPRQSWRPPEHHDEKRAIAAAVSAHRTKTVRWCRSILVLRFSAMVRLALA
jgi:hypothetical protein